MSTALKSPFLPLVLSLLLAVTLLPVVALPTQAQETEPALRIAPAIADNTAVRAGHQITVSGTIPAGEITAVRLHGIDALGQRITHTYPGAVANGNGFEFVRRSEDGEKVEGRLTVPCQFDVQDRFQPNECARAVETWDAQLELVVGGAPALSNLVRVDSVRPEIRRFELLAPDRIRVVFTEPVRAIDGVDSPTDWQVGAASGAQGSQNDPVTAVTEVQGPFGDDCVYPPGEDPDKGSSGCTRVLVLRPPLDGDANPFVRYEPAPGRNAYEDYVDLQIVRGEESGTNPSRALDIVRPAIPSIEEIAGKETAEDTQRVDGRERAPQVRVGNLTPGHTLAVQVEPGEDPAPVTVDDSDCRPTTTAASACEETVQLRSLPRDGAYTILAVAIDESENVSTDRSKAGPRADGQPNPIVYGLDTVAPVLVGAHRLDDDPRRVTVVLREPVYPEGHAGRWTVGDQPALAEGEGAERTLQTPREIPTDADVRVTWEPGPVPTRDSYRDAAGNLLQPDFVILGALPPLPPVPTPLVTQPAGETYTRDSSIDVVGLAPGEGTFTVDLVERRSGRTLQSTTPQNGRYRFTVPLPADARYLYSVQVRDTTAGTTSQRATVPDIVRDTAAPVVDVTSPARALPTQAADGRERYGVGGTVTVTWRATDAAPTDDQRQDHGSVAVVSAVFDNGPKRELGRVPHQPGAQQQAFAYTFSEADLAGFAGREVRFTVDVHDLASNVGTDTSAPVLLVGGLVDYMPLFTSLRTVEVRFPVELSGATTAPEWLYDQSPEFPNNPSDDTPVQQAEKTSRDGRTVILLTIASAGDPNPLLTVRYAPLAANPTPLQGPGGTDVSRVAHFVVDAVAPSLELQTTPPDRPIDANLFRLSGRTDPSTRAHTIEAVPADAAWNPSGAAVATSTAARDGSFALDVPLRQDAVNRFLVRAVDEAGNRSAGVAFLVVEDSLAPVVTLTAPVSAGAIGDPATIRWTTVEANPTGRMQLEFRRGAAAWTTIAADERDDGEYVWDVPDDLHNETLDLRLRTEDLTGKTGFAVAEDVHVDLAGPVLRSARTTGAQVVEVVFDEPVEITEPTEAFAIEGGAVVREMKGTGTKRTLILGAPVPSTTPTIAVADEAVTDSVGNRGGATAVTATRSFAFAVTNLTGSRLSPTSVRLEWDDPRNRAGDLEGYRIYRDNRPVAFVPVEARTYVDRDGSGRHTWIVRAVDDRGRHSSARRVRVR